METSTVTMSLKDYEELRQFKDNFHKKNFASVCNKDCIDFDFIYTFYSDEEMNKVLLEKISKLQDCNNSLNCELIDLRNNIKNTEIQIDRVFEQKEYYGKQIESVKKLNSFGFLSWIKQKDNPLTIK